MCLHTHGYPIMLCGEFRCGSEENQSLFVSSERMCSDKKCASRTNKQVDLICEKSVLKSFWDKLLHHWRPCQDMGRIGQGRSDLTVSDHESFVREDKLVLGCASYDLNVKGSCLARQCQPWSFHPPTHMPTHKHTHRNTCVHLCCHAVIRI